MSWPLSHLTNVNAPVPTIAVLSNVPLSSSLILLQMCSGRIGTHSWVMIGSGASMWTSTVVASGASAFLMFLTYESYVPFGSAFARFNVNATSEAVIGWPSDQFTPDRILKVQVRPSGVCVHEVARPGTGLKSFCDQPRSRS